MSFIFNYEHIQCVRTNFIIAVTCRLVDLLTCRLESVRDWSGILCEPCGDGNGNWERGTGTGNGNGNGDGNGNWGRETGIRERGGDVASKDIAESPTAKPERQH